MEIYLESFKATKRQRISNVEWQMSNDECQVLNVNCRMSNVECRVFIGPRCLGSDLCVPMSVCQWVREVLLRDGIIGQNNVELLAKTGFFDVVFLFYLVLGIGYIYIYMIYTCTYIQYICTYVHMVSHHKNNIWPKPRPNIYI